MLLTLLGTVLNPRPEQGVMALTGRYGHVRGDTGCVALGTDQRVLWPGINGPGDMPEQGVHGYSQE